MTQPAIECWSLTTFANTLTIMQIGHICIFAIIFYGKDLSIKKLIFVIFIKKEVIISVILSLTTLNKTCMDALSRTSSCTFGGA